MNERKIGMLFGVIITASILTGVFVMQPHPTEKLVPSLIRTWIMTGEYNPGAGVSGFLTIHTRPHSDTGTTTYATNVSEGTAYEYNNALTGEMTGTTPHTTAFDFYIKWVVNASDCYNETKAGWEDTWTRCNLSVDFDTHGDLTTTTLTQTQITNNSEMAWYAAWANNSNSGYQLYPNEHFSYSATIEVYRLQ